MIDRVQAIFQPHRDFVTQRRRTRRGLFLSAVACAFSAVIFLIEPMKEEI
jgi:hypothetical protein